MIKNNIKMKTKILIILTTAMFGVAHAQQSVNNGGAIVVNDGTVMVIKGDLLNQTGGSMNNNGEMKISGNWTNEDLGGSLLQGTTGKVTFNGTAPQTVGGSAKTWFNNLEIQNDINMNTETSVSSILNIQSGNVFLASSDLVIESGATMTGAGPTQYIVAENSGRLVQEVGVESVSYPVGTSESYVPVTLSNSGTTDNIGINVFKDVLDGGTTGTTIPEIDHCVNNTWIITEETAGGCNLTITTQWNLSDEGISFDRTQSGIGHYSGGEWDKQSAIAAQGTGPYTLTRSGITSLSAFAVGDINSPMAIQVAITLDMTVFLEGPYIPASGGTMSTGLNTSGYLPLAQPYNPTLPYYDIVDPGELKWLYGGSESVGAIPPDVVDWVLVQLREADLPENATSATILDTQAAFLKNDGTVVGLDGVNPLHFDVSFTENLYAVVYHRNHLAIISNYPLTESGGVYTYNFSSSADQAYGGANGHKLLEADIWGMVAGDGNGNGLIQNTDETAAWKADLGNSGYMGGDFNLNGLTQNTDEANYWKINLGSGGQTPGKQSITSYKSQVPD